MPLTFKPPIFQLHGLQMKILMERWRPYSKRNSKILCFYSKVPFNTVFGYVSDSLHC